MTPLSKPLPGYIPINGVIQRRDNGFVLQVDARVLQRMALEGWSITQHGPYALATCPPPAVPEVPSHKGLD